MARDGGGTMIRNDGTTLGNVWGKAKLAGRKILSADHDLHDQDIANEITNSVAKDGQTVMTGDLQMGNNDILLVDNITGTGGIVNISDNLSVALGALFSGAVNITEDVGLTILNNAFGSVFATSADSVVVGSAAKLVIPTSTPASASATGTLGTVTWDANYIYICTATDTWKRVSIATW